MSASAERYRPELRAEWDALVRRARARHFLFERDYMDYHAERFPDASLLVAWDGRPVAALPASRHGDEVVSHGGLTFGGLLSGAELTARRAVEALEAVAAALRADGVRRLVYKPVPHPYHLAPAEEDLFALHRAGARLVHRELACAVAPGAGRPRYSDERARAVRRAAPVALGESGAIEEYMALVADVLRERHGAAPVHSAAEMRLLADRFPGRIRLFAATESGAVVAGVLVYETPAVARAQYIATGARGRELGAQDALFDHLLHRVYPDRWFDFGTSHERDGTLNDGLQRNKEGFGGRSIACDRYVLEL